MEGCWSVQLELSRTPPTVSAANVTGESGNPCYHLRNQYASTLAELKFRDS